MRDTIITSQEGAHEHTPAQNNNSSPVTTDSKLLTTAPTEANTKALVPVEDDEDEEYVPLPTATLPISDKHLPLIIRDIVGNAPDRKKVAAFVAAQAPLCALSSRVRTNYYHDPNRPHALLVQTVIEAPQSAGKSFAADIEGLIMNDTLKARDKAQRRLEQDYRERKKRRRANEKLEEEPQTTVCVIPPTISKTVLTKRADLYERKLGDTPTFWMFAEELAQVTDASKNGYSNLRTIMRTAYDLGSMFGIDFASDQSYSAIADINICSMFCATPAALDEYYDKKAIEGGNITRCIICPLSDNIEDDNENFRPYSEEQIQSIRQTLNKMMDNIYDADGHLQPTMKIDMHWLDRDCRRFIKNKAELYATTGSEAVKVFRKRSSVSAFRGICMCYYLYSLEYDFDPTLPYTDNPKQKKAQMLCRKLYQFLSEYIFENMLRRWGRKYNELNSKRYQESQAPDTSLFKMLTHEFTRDQLKLLIEQTGCTTQAKQFIWMWGPKKMNIIEVIDKNHFRKK